MADVAYQVDIDRGLPISDLFGTRQWLIWTDFTAFLDTTAAESQGAKGWFPFGEVAVPGALTLSVPTDDRDGRMLFSVIAWGQMVAHRASGLGVGEIFAIASKNPRFLIRWIPPSPLQTMDYVIAGYVNSEASQPFGAYLRQETIGNLFFVSHGVAVPETTDLGPPPTVMTEYLIYTEDAGVSWCCEVDGVVRAVHATQVPVVSHGLQPTVYADVQASTVASFVMDLLAAWGDL